MTGAEAAAACLVKEGVEYVFGYPGVAIVPFFDSLLDTGIQAILVRQEQNAAHAASGYARITGRPGVVAVTSGPGAENLITGIATAFADSIPLVCITGQVETSLMGGDVFQEADISGACESFVKYSYILRNVNDIPRVFREAFYIAGTGRKGPVLIDFPADIQKAAIHNFVYPETVRMRTYKPTVEGHAVQIDKVMQELSKAKRPIICAGGGVHLSDAAEEVRTFAEQYNIPVVCTMMGLGVMPTQHPLFYGMVGNNGQKYGNAAMNEADMIIMAGARVADRSISQPSLITEGKILVHIDVDPAEIGKNAGPTIPLVGDIAHVFHSFHTHKPVSCDHAAWVAELNRRRTAEEAEKNATLKRALLRADAQEASGVDPAAFVRALSLAMEPDGVYVADVGQNQLWSCANAVIRSGGRFLTSGGMGTMGYAVPAAMGAQLAAPGRQVVAVCGDGGFQMTMMELATLRYYNIPARIVVMKNLSLGLVRQHQHLAYHDRYTVTDLGGYPRLDRLTEAYDMDYLLLDRDADIHEKIAAFLNAEDPVLLEVDVSPDRMAFGDFHKEYS